MITFLCKMVQRYFGVYIMLFWKINAILENFDVDIFLITFNCIF